MGFEQYITDDFGNAHPPAARDWDQWVSASRTRNWCKRNALHDWLERHGDVAGFERDPDPDPRTDFREFIFAQGRAFEAGVLALLSRRVSVFTIGGFERPAQSLDACRETYAAMVRAEPIISQGVLWNPQNQTYGAADALIRSDVLHALFPEAISATEVGRGAPGLSLGNCHYRVVDMKFTTLRLDKRGNASSEHLPYTAQVFLYNEALGRIQGYTPEHSYILGRSWSGPRGGERRNCMDRLATVPRNWCGKQGLLKEIVRDAIDWVRRVRSEGDTWHPISGPTTPELRPNPTAADFPWIAATEQIADETRDPILAWQVGYGARDLAAVSGITRWTDPGFTAASVGLNGSRGVILDTLLEVNRNPEAPLVFPPRVKAERELWKDQGPVEFYVDFETVSDVNDSFSSLPARGGQPMIYMIGCGHMEAGTWQFARFVADRLEAESEAEVIEAWLDHMETVRRRLSPELKSPLVFHWSPAESSGLTNGLKSARTRHPERSRHWKEPNGYDFLGRVVRAEPVVVKGPMGFGLKTIARSFQQAGLIETAWEDNITDGLGAMVGAWWCYDEASRTGKRVHDIELMQAIESYNEVDCRVMMEVIEYLRMHH